MRRPLTIVLAASLLVGAFGTTDAGAKRAKKPRTVETKYTEPAVGAAGAGVCFQGSSCVFVEPLPGEKFVSIEIVDDLGLPVNASVIQDTNGDGNYLIDDGVIHICGETTEPLKIEPGTVTVWVWRTPGLVPPCPGTATSGTVKTTFSTKP